ncbi:MAG: response regulator [Desulfobacterales bacterium]|nr:response regulator [Desulfobacterales bacterium]
MESQQMKVLVVDDSATIRALIRNELEQGGYTVFEAANGILGLSKAAEVLPDLITLDIEMPKLNGFMTFEKLIDTKYARFFTHKKDGRIPVIFVTSKDTIEDRKKGFDLGAVDFILKPFTEGEILRTVSKILKPEAPIQNLTALVIDDSETARMIVSNCLKREGVKIIEASSGIQAFEILCNRMAEIDMVIMDNIMPEMNGEELCKKIRNELKMKDIPIIILTAYVLQSNILGFFQSGATDYLVKPFVSEELLARLKVHLERTQLNNHLRESVEQLRTLNKIKDNVLAVCSHDLRSPLNSILGFSDLLLEKDYIVPEDKVYLQQIKKNGEFQLSLIEDLLDASKIQSKETELKLEPIPLNTIVQSSVNAFKHLAMRKSITLFSNQNDIDQIIILGNSTALLRVINNLLSNAIKFTPENGHIRLEMVIVENDTVHVSVMDTGIGIPPEHMEHLFDEFTDASTSGTKGEKGTGLGLSIVKALVEKHQGQISVTSKPKEGTCFTLSFPVLKKIQSSVAKETVQTQQYPLQSNLDSGLPEMHILAAEDYEPNQMILQQFLKKTRVILEIVENGEKVLEKLNMARYDVILMDMNMPVMDGYTAIQKIRHLEIQRTKDKISTRIPIIALTAHDSNEDRERIFQIGADDYLSKPLKKKDLHQMLSKWAKNSE